MFDPYSISMLSFIERKLTPIHWQTLTQASNHFIITDSRNDLLLSPVQTDLLVWIFPRDCDVVKPERHLPIITCELAIAIYGELLYSPLIKYESQDNMS